MAVDQKKRQKKLMQKKSKRKAVVLSKRRENKEPVVDLPPIYECLIARDMSEAGIGTVIISREMPDGSIMTAFFLLDIYCLGVKDTHLNIFSSQDYLQHIQRLGISEKFDSAPPENARKLIEDSVQYARQFGLTPNKNYKQAKKIFGDIDASSCQDQFEFGKDGKPYFIQGPNDSNAKSHKILKSLEKSCGIDGFNYLLPTEPVTTGLSKSF